MSISSVSKYLATWHKHCSHRPSILRQLQAYIDKLNLTLSCDTKVFKDAAQTYQNGLGHSNFSHKLEYMPHVTQQPRRNRQRNIIWFNPSFSKIVKINIACMQFSHELSSRLQVAQNVQDEHS